MWDRSVELDFFAPAMEGVRNAVAGLAVGALSGPYDYDQISEIVARSCKRVENFYTDLEARLQSGFIAGGKFLVADTAGLVSVDFATGGLKMPIPEKAQAIRRWYACISARRSSLA